MKRQSDPDSQRMKILAHLARGHRLTPMEALNRFGAGRLASRIFDLKRGGYRIQRRMVPTISGAWVAEYWLPLQRRKSN